MTCLGEILKSAPASIGAFADVTGEEIFEKYGKDVSASLRLI